MVSVPLLSLPHHGEQHLRDGPLGPPHGGFRHAQKDVRLAVDALEVLQQLLLDPALGTGTDAVDEPYQELNQGVGNLAAPGPQEGGPRLAD